MDGWVRCVVVGFCGHSADELCERLMAAIDEANAGRGNIYGGRLIYGNVLTRWTHSRQSRSGKRGGPRPVFLKEFYGRHERWVEFKGAVDPRPIRLPRLLLQGCPASALLLAGIMRVRVVAAKARASHVSLGGFLDGRVL